MRGQRWGTVGRVEEGSDEGAAVIARNLSQTRNTDGVAVLLNLSHLRTSSTHAVAKCGYTEKKTVL